MLAYTGLETVANYAEEARRPGRDLPRSLFSAITLVVVIYVLIASSASRPIPSDDGTTALGTDWLRAPLMGIVVALQLAPAALVRPDPTRLRRPDRRARAARRDDDVDLRLRPARVLARRARPAAGDLRPPAPADARRRPLRSSRRRRSRSRCSSARRSRASVTFLASLFSFGVLLAFTAAQLAVIRLRMTKPDLRRPFRVPLGIRVRGAAIPLPVDLRRGAARLRSSSIAMVTHAGARYGGPVWLAAGPRRLRDGAARPRRGPARARASRPTSRCCRRRRSRRSSCR